MKYKIYKTIHRDLNIKNCSNGSRKTELIETTVFYAKRKGRFFGFWHKVGEKICDYDGVTFIVTEYFTNPKDCEDFVKKFHKYHYGDKHKLEIYKQLKIK